MSRKVESFENWTTNKEGLPSRFLKTVVPVKGVPFLSQTRHEKPFVLTYRDNTKIEVDFENRSLDIPFADVFYVKEKWLILSTSPNAYKVIFR
jgi:hypothetical protein